MKKALLALVALVATTAVAEAQVKNRWRLQWSNEKPQIYTYRTPNDHYENYWFFTYTLENTSDEIIPLIVDVLLYTESGKELQNDFRKIESPVIKEERDNPKKAEALKFGRFYANVIDPEAEYKIIEYHAKIGNRSDGIVRESIEAFKKGFTADPPEQFKDVRDRGKWKKGDRIYLNPREIRDARFIQPGQRIHGIAIFKNVDPRAHVYELHVAGLVDIVKITAVTEDEWKMEYEPQTLKIRYERQGDAVRDRARRDLPDGEEGVRHQKDRPDRVEGHDRQARQRPRRHAQEGAGVARGRQQKGNVPKLRAADGIDELDTRIMAMVFRLAVEKTSATTPPRTSSRTRRPCGASTSGGSPTGRSWSSTR
jgi:regulator of RNase E activity RraB